MEKPSQLTEYRSRHGHRKGEISTSQHADLQRAALFGAQKNAPLPRLTAHIYNYAAIPAAELLGAEREAQDVFHEAGIDVE
jgi:hypothetical protein